MQPRRCGTPFCLGAWEQTSPAIDTWAALASERSSLRDQLQASDESRLLALGLDALQKKWQPSLASWFLPKWFGAMALMKELQSVRTDGTKAQPPPDSRRPVPSDQPEALNQELAAIQPADEETLGVIWRNGAPTSDDLDDCFKQSAGVISASHWTLRLLAVEWTRELLWPWLVRASEYFARTSCAWLPWPAREAWS